MRNCFNTTGRGQTARKRISVNSWIWLCVLPPLFLAACGGLFNGEDLNKKQKEDPSAVIVIHNAEEFAQIGLSAEYPPDGNYALEANANITLSGWKPIGTWETPFTGTFDGNGNSGNGAVITIQSFAPAETESTGLFGYVMGTEDKPALIKNVKISVTVDAALEEGVEYAGAAAGYVTEAVMENISVSGALKYAKAEGGLFLGGIAGYAYNAVIRDCSNAAALEAVTVSGGFAGGIAGYGAGGLVIEDCRSSGDVSVKAAAFNASAGGIAGTLKDNKLASRVTRCTASGSVSLTETKSGGPIGWMFYCGGIVGYAGNGTAALGGGNNTGGAICAQNSYTGSLVYCKTAYPYAGGIIGYNYTGSQVSESYALGLVKAEGTNLPYAGGVAGYVSAGASVENSYSTARVEASASSKQALAGGVSGAAAKNGVISKCYAAGEVRAAINGGGSAGMGGSLGVPAAANAGGITGTLYYESPKVESCAALNTGLSGEDTAAGGAINVYRVAGKVDGSLVNNAANPSMVLSGGNAGDRGGEGQDGADIDAATPVQSVFESLGWDFEMVWKMGAEGRPVLRWQGEN
jgi:hypothetical protein